MSKPCEYSDWLPVPQAATALAISERTLRRRVKAGELAARKVARDGGGTLLLVCVPDSGTAKLPMELPTVPDSGTATFEREYSGGTAKLTTKLPTVPAKVDSVPANRAGQSATGDTGGELLAQLQTENEYLKSQVNAWRLQAEAANRTASETAAALRKALDAMPRELAAPTQSTLAEAREDAPQTPQSGAATQPTGHTPNAPQRPAQREMRPLWKVILGIR